MRIVRALTAMAALTALALGLAAPAGARMQVGHYNAIVEGRYDFHTWLFSFSSCDPPTPLDTCAMVSANPMPIAKAFQWYGQAHQANGTWTLVVDVPEPDSPTMPSVSPAFSSKLMPSTARSCRSLRCSTPPVTLVNVTARSCTLKTGLLTPHPPPPPGSS